MERCDVLFPDCCYGCDHFTSVRGNCGHELSHDLVSYFVDNPDVPCPASDSRPR